MKRFLFLVAIIICITLTIKYRIDSVSSQKATWEKTITSKLQKSSQFTLSVFASGLTAPRDIAFSPNKTLLASIPSRGQVVALPDQDRDGKADETVTVVKGLVAPHGIAFFGKYLFVAALDGVYRYDWNEEKLEATKEKLLFALPTDRGHTYRSIVFDKEGDMFVSVGSTCNVCTETNKLHATILKSDQNGKNPEIYASGLRNAAFLAIDPKTNRLFATEMGRDYLGDELPPDEINSIEKGGNYGWPICYGDKIHDTSFDKNIYVRDPCQDTKSPFFQIPAHSAPLGLAFVNNAKLPKDWQGDLLIAYHGSWNRTTPIGYKVVRLSIENGKAIQTTDVFSGFLAKGETNRFNATGRPVAIVINTEGTIFVSDDKGGIIYTLSYGK